MTVPDHYTVIFLTDWRIVEEDNSFHSYHCGTSFRLHFLTRQKDDHGFTHSRSRNHSTRLTCVQGSRGPLYKFGLLHIYDEMLSKVYYMNCSVKFCKDKIPNFILNPQIR